MTTSRPTLLTTVRDLAVLSDLGSFRFLSVPQVAVLHFGTKGAADARLRRLHRAGLIVRVFMPVRPYDRRSQSIYALGAKGAQLVPPDPTGARPRHLSTREQRSGLFLDHTLRRNDVRICFELLSRTWPHLKLVHWKQTPEEVGTSTAVATSRTRTERVPLVPDGMAVLSVHDRITILAIEIDMGTVRLQRMALRYRGYLTWWRQGGAARRFGPGPFRVLTLTTTDRRLEALRNAARRSPEAGNQGSGLFWFAPLSVADISQPEQLISTAWTVSRAKDTGMKSLF